MDSPNHDYHCLLVSFSFIDVQRHCDSSSVATFKDFGNVENLQ